MKKFIFSLTVAAMIFASCSDTDEEETVTTPAGFVNTPLAGKIYSSDFVIGGGYARPIKSNGVDSFYIYFDTKEMECFSVSSATPLWITVPAVKGTYDSKQVSAQFRNSNGGFEGAADEQVEITEITETSIKGKLRAVGFNDKEHSVNGTFEVQYCPL